MVREARAGALTNGVAVDLVGGPVTAATEYLTWTSVAESAVNMLLIGLVALILAVAFVPVEAGRHRFGGSGPFDGAPVGRPARGRSRPARRPVMWNGHRMRMYNGAPVQPDAPGCCVGLTGISASGYQTCVSDPTTSGTLTFTDTVEVYWAFTCDRHDVVLTRPRPLTAADVAELNRRIRLADAAG